MEKARDRDSKQENFRRDSRVSDERRFGGGCGGRKLDSGTVIDTVARDTSSKFMFLI